jgi:hypothetical protein
VYCDLLFTLPLKARMRVRTAQAEKCILFVVFECDYEFHTAWLCVVLVVVDVGRADFSLYRSSNTATRTSVYTH